MDISRAYTGRGAAAGMTEAGMPALLYAVTGRSPASMERKATILYGNGVPHSVHIGPPE